VVTAPAPCYRLFIVGEQPAEDIADNAATTTAARIGVLRAGAGGTAGDLPPICLAEPWVPGRSLLGSGHSDE